MVDPRRVLTFREVARLGSFSRAAEALSLTQPAVSQQVAALERQAGAQLLERGPGGLSLTPAGELLLEHADVVADRLELAAGQLAELAGARGARAAGRRVPERARHARAAALARLTAERPEVKADVAEGTTDELVEGVRVRRAARRGLLPGRRRARGASTRARSASTSARSRSRALLPPGHRLAGAGRSGSRDLADETWVAPVARAA